MVKIKILKTIIPIALLLTLAICSNIFLGNEKYMLSAVIAAIISCFPMLIRFENRHNSGREIVIIAVMIALCVLSRLLFGIIPHFKPITAMIIISGIYLGADAGFVIGSFTALLSNMQFGHGPWTPFQMAVWGLIGFLSGLLSKHGFFNNKSILLLFSAFSGVLYSLVLDVYTTISVDSVFSIERYMSYILVALPVTVEYIISNAVFILLLEKPIGKKLERIKTKYGIFN